MKLRDSPKTKRPKTSRSEAAEQPVGDLSSLGDVDLLHLMEKGAEEALTVLYRRRQGGIYRFVFQMCGSRAMAEDITQEVFIVLIGEHHTFDPTQGSLNGFLLGVARNQLLRRLRRERFYVSATEDPDLNPANAEMRTTAASPLDDLSRGEVIEAVRKAILSLPERYREVVVLCELNEMSYTEAAAVLGCSVGTVRSRLHRARALLIEKLRSAREQERDLLNVKSARCFA